MPEVDAVEAEEINTGDLRVDTYRASGAGGQHVNKTDSAIRLTHLPTGIVVECQDERSQHKNRARAMSLLQAKLLEMERQQQASEQAETRRNLVGSGDRSERIRTYNFPQGRVTDHRINLTLYKLDDIVAGNLDQVIDPLINEYQADQLTALAGGVICRFVITCALCAEKLAQVSDSPRLDAEVLLAHCLDKPRSFFYTWPEREPDEVQTGAFNALVAQRLEGHPIAHLTGNREFWGLELDVTVDTLIPRPETELLVETALQYLTVGQKLDKPRVLDLGTGSGAIALALASELPQADITATDKSMKCIGWLLNKTPVNIICLK